MNKKNERILKRNYMNILKKLEDDLSNLEDIAWHFWYFWHFFSSSDNIHDHCSCAYTIACIVFIRNLFRVLVHSMNSSRKRIGRNFGWGCRGGTTLIHFYYDANIFPCLITVENCDTVVSICTIKQTDAIVRIY